MLTSHCDNLSAHYYQKKYCFTGSYGQNSVFFTNRPRSIYQYSSMAPRLSGQNCKFFKFPMSLNSQKRLRYKENNTKYRGLTWKPLSHVRILIYRTWPIAVNGMLTSHCDNLSRHNYHLTYHPCFDTKFRHDQTTQQYCRALAVSSRKTRKRSSFPFVPKRALKRKRGSS